MARIRMPERVLVAAHAYTITRCCSREMTSGEDGHLGDTDYETLSIRIKKGMRRSKVQEVLLHEVLHACTYHFWNMDDKVIGEEEAVTMLSPILLQVLQDNPELIAFISDK